VVSAEPDVWLAAAFALVFAGVALAAASALLLCLWRLPSVSLGRLISEGSLVYRNLAAFVQPQRKWHILATAYAAVASFLAGAALLVSIAAFGP